MRVRACVCVIYPARFGFLVGAMRAMNRHSLENNTTAPHVRDVLGECTTLHNHTHTPV